MCYNYATESVKEVAFFIVKTRAVMNRRLIYNIR